MANQVFNLIQEEKRRARLRPIGWTRNALIGLGALAGAWIALSGLLSRTPANGNGTEPATVAAVQLNTAAPPTLPVIQLARPVALEQPFGRTLLTGTYVESVPRDPLETLEVDRRFDGAGLPASFRPPTDLPAAPASDEVREEPKHPGAQAPSVPQDDEFAHLPQEVRERVTTARNLYTRARALMSEVAPIHRDWSSKQGQAADLLKQARDEVTLALRGAPGERVLLDLMQEIKADLYSANKHRLK